MCSNLTDLLAAFQVSLDDVGDVVDDWLDTSGSGLWKILCKPISTWKAKDVLRGLPWLLRIFALWQHGCASYSLAFMHDVLPDQSHQLWISLWQEDLRRGTKLLQSIAILYGRLDVNLDGGSRALEFLDALVTTGIQQGVDLHQYDALLDNRRRHEPPTPLHSLLCSSILVNAYDAELYVTNALRYWISTLERADVDLLEYGATASELGCAVDYGIRHRMVYGFTYRSRPQDWSPLLEHPGDGFAGIFWDAIEHPERSLPGSWVESQTYTSTGHDRWDDRYFDDCLDWKVARKLAGELEHHGGSADDDDPSWHDTDMSEILKFV